jgi:hypothetical protein
VPVAGDDDSPPGFMAEQAVEKFFCEAPPSHYMDTMQDIFSMLKGRSRSSAFVGWSVDRGLRLEPFT